MGARNGDGFTALHVAAMWGREGSVRELLGRGADPIVCDNEDMTPLDYAESEGIYHLLNSVLIVTVLICEAVLNWIVS